MKNDDADGCGCRMAAGKTISFCVGMKYALTVCGVTPTDGALIRDHFSAAEIVSISDCGHNPHYEKREEFVAVLCDRLC